MNGLILYYAMTTDDTFFFQIWTHVSKTHYLLMPESLEEGSAIPNPHLLISNFKLRNIRDSGQFPDTSL